MTDGDVDSSAPIPTIQGNRTAAVRGPALSSDIDGAKPAPGAAGDAKNIGKELEKSLEEMGKAAQDAGKDLRELGKGLLNILK